MTVIVVGTVAGKMVVADIGIGIARQAAHSPAGSSDGNCIEIEIAFEQSLAVDVLVR